MNGYKHVFGPVPSRRFGRSLGIDLTPYKTCSFDCIFCQLGRTAVKTMERKEYVSYESVINELDQWIKSEEETDYITLAGSGEPTLHSRLGEIIDFIHTSTSIPVALLTNGSLLSDSKVRAEAARADVVKVSLSAGDQTQFKYLNQPHTNLTIDGLVNGIKTFRSEFKGELWLEVFVAWGINSTPTDISRIAEWAKSFKPDRIQLNTAIRPPVKKFVRAVPREKLDALAKRFTPQAEVIAEFNSNATPSSQANEETILAILQRRPCTATQISIALGLHPNETAKYLGKLDRMNRIQSNKINSETHYFSPTKAVSQ